MRKKKISTRARNEDGRWRTFEEGLEVADAEALVIVALDDLEEEGRPVLHGFREDLQEVALSEVSVTESQITGTAKGIGTDTDTDNVIAIASKE
jgi:hypothetical protein